MPSRFTVKRQFFKLLGAGFHIEDERGQRIGYCRQKAFRLREDIRICTDESQSTELVRLAARSILDFSTTYDVFLPDGTSVGSLRRKGMASTFLRDSWRVFNEQGQQIGVILEDSMGKALARRFLPVMSIILPQQFLVHRTSTDAPQPGSQPVAVFKQRFTVFVYTMDIDVLVDNDPDFDELLMLAAGCLVAAIEGRQDGQSY